MRTSIKEVYSIAKRALPGCEIAVSVELGSVYSWKKKEENRAEWTISAKKDEGEVKSETDEIFSVALSKLVAEIARTESSPIEDVVVEDDPPLEVDESAKQSNKGNNDLPF